ncbi:hypothetical protein PanWU01x14_169620 [Parasponia andersonii]|uniref:Protein GLUTAMINE DUMPER n=1 Tax=Parasponia andersonii TaxID=3476 RepID=A0A2P5CAI1_PARAD|nr:hypothetical protein PanWU01x14_169620 [Parasponia andersonii]
MRDLRVGEHETTSSGTKTTTNVWKSPTPYLFGSLALMLLLISVALVLLICSYRKRYSSHEGRTDHDHQHDHEDKPTKAVDHDDGPKIVVIMAGDDRPTYFAKPAVVALPQACSCSCSSTSTSTATTNDHDDHEIITKPMSD